ncbi:MAG: glycoside hydrolase domain-containing protein, partial [Armatimonadota bacterium]
MRIAIAVSVVLMAAAPVLAYTDLSDPNEPWLQDPVGVSTDVPHPFEPLTVDGATVSCWGREYSLAAPLPAQITSQGQELLAAPVRVIVEAAGETHVLSELPVTVGEARGDRVELSGAGEAGPIALSIEGWLEYDGLMQVTLTASGDVTVDRLSVEVPVRPEIARFMHSSRRWGQYVYQRVGEPGWSWSPE